jgi:hypothetical protein
MSFLKLKGTGATLLISTRHDSIKVSLAGKVHPTADVFLALLDEYFELNHEDRTVKIKNSKGHYRTLVFGSFIKEFEVIFDSGGVQVVLLLEKEEFWMDMDAMREIAEILS